MRDRFLAFEDLAHDGDIVAQPVVRPAPGFAVPAFDDLRPGHAKAGDETAAAGQRIHRAGTHRGIGRRAGGDLHDAGAQADALRHRGEIRQRGDGVGAVGLGAPDGVVAELLGLLHQGDGNVEMGGGIADGQAELHAGTPCDVSWRAGGRWMSWPDPYPQSVRGQCCWRTTRPLGCAKKAVNRSAPLPLGDSRSSSAQQGARWNRDGGTSRSRHISPSCHTSPSCHVSPSCHTSPSCHSAFVSRHLLHVMAGPDPAIDTGTIGSGYNGTRPVGGGRPGQARP